MALDITYTSLTSQPRSNFKYYPMKLQSEHVASIIDLFTDTAAILNLFYLRSIMGCPGGTRSENFTIYISLEKSDH